MEFLKLVRSLLNYRKQEPSQTQTFVFGQPAPFDSRWMAIAPGLYVNRIKYENATYYRERREKSRIYMEELREQSCLI